MTSRRSSEIATSTVDGSDDAADLESTANARVRDRLPRVDGNEL
ncbi:hypothetical protein OB955_01245 [Halobacteria archaeon AArc-m2/3/4]|uniref:Uncharacterized protein n=1 Tax=Natronoglomus mannanivorans TaxID=2979990 RepID=A0ABT2Q8W5_9EURY|nr:hypothetical protein [Halobacteria archaeon AArc-m2/3/4]